MAKVDPTVSSLETALAKRLEIDFRLAGVPVTMRPHILYVAKDGTLSVSGMIGSGILAHVAVSQIKDLIAGVRHFQPDTAFDFSNPRYDNPIARVADI